MMNREKRASEFTGVVTFKVVDSRDGTLRRESCRMKLQPEPLSDVAVSVLCKDGNPSLELLAVWSSVRQAKK